ncbi:MAG: elongation factor G [Victivallales bacterium]|nr:elongation factor G [Victivallales bacterium]
MGRFHPLASIRNIGIMAHIDAGKTTCSERILYYTGRTHKLGETHDGASTMDFMVQEKERGITIASAATTCVWRDHQINLIDTPGHVDFTAEVERSLRILDGAIGLFCAVGGVEPQSETVWRQAEKYHVPRICFVNKMDRVGANFFHVVKQIHDILGANPVPVTIPIDEGPGFTGIIDLVHMVKVTYNEDAKGTYPVESPLDDALKQYAEPWRQKLIESVAEMDDTLLAKFFNEEPISNEEIIAAIRASTIAQKLCPVLCGSAFRNKGVQRLLDAVVDFLPSPLDVPPAVGKDFDGNEVERPEDDHAPAAALAFKVVTDRNVGKLIYVRVYAGKLESGSYIYNANKRKAQRISRLFRMHANHREDIDALYSGEIGAVVGLSETVTGDTLCDESAPLVMESITFPEPVISITVRPVNRGDRDKLSTALMKLAEEDPTFTEKFNQETEQTIISGMGELHLDIIVDRLRREFNIPVECGKPEVSYRETCTQRYEHDEVLKKQTGGHGQFAKINIALEPSEKGTGFVFENIVKGGNIPKEYFPAIEKGMRDSLDEGPVAGYPVVDVKVTLLDGAYHEVDSSDMAFRTCAATGFRTALLKAKPILLEPIMKLNITTPTEHAGTITGNLCARRGKVLGIDTISEKAQLIHASCPLANLFGYTSELRNMTQGRAAFNMEFDFYEPVPQSLAEEIIKARREKKNNG